MKPLPGHCSGFLDPVGAFVRVGSARARRRGTGPLIWAVDPQAPTVTGRAARSLTVGLVLPWLAQLTRAHVDIGCHRARAAGSLLDTACRRVKTSLGRRALLGAGEVGGVRVAALLARQRRACALGAERAWSAWLTSGLGLVPLECAGPAPIARTLAGVGLDGAGAAGRRIGAARRREVARVGSRAVSSGAKVGPAGVCALAARQRRRRAFRAVRARHAHVALGPAGLVHELARAAPVTRGLLVQRLHSTLTTRHLLGAACWRKVARFGLGALTAVGEAGGAGVRALFARQRRAGALGAVRARVTGDTFLLALAGLVLACRTLDARGHARVWRDRAGAARCLPGATGWRVVALGSWRAFLISCEVGGVGGRALPARQRSAGALGAVRSLLARLAPRLLPLVLKRAFSARHTKTHPRVSCECAGAAGLRRGAARGRGETWLGLDALRGAAEVGTTRVRALLARQRRARAKRAEVPRLAGDARLLALLGLVRTGRALVASAHLGAGRDAAGATLGLLRAARRCVVACVSRRTLLGTTEVSGARVRTLAARQRRRRALRTVRARHAHVALDPAGFVHKLARVALVARGPLVQRLHGTRAARRRTGAACGCVRAWHGGRAIVSGAEVGLVGVRARRARQRRARPERAVRPGLTGDARLFALVGLVLAGLAPVARGHFCVGCDRAGAAPGLLCTARWRKVARVGLGALSGAGEVGGAGVRALLARQRRAGARWAVRARVTGKARLLALALLVRAGRALGARGRALVWRDGAGAARRLPDATGWRVVALGGRRAFLSSCEVGGVRILALGARQSGRRARRALARRGLVLACRALVARGRARVWRDRAGAALTRLRRARTARRSRRALQAVVGARHRDVELQNRLVLVGACLARQRGRRALRAVRAGRARPAHQLTRRGLEGAGLALETRAHACVGCDRAGAALGLLGAARRREVALVGPRAPTAAGE
eukprot:scaffold19084_cov64-Phaeocystis_antarctica.AAC.1